MTATPLFYSGERRVAAGLLPEKDASVERRETRYAWNGDISLAYQVVGDGDVDLLYLPGWASNVDTNWESPLLA